MRTFRAIVWAEEQVPNTDPRDREKLPVLSIRSRQFHMIQHRNQSDILKQFKASLGSLAAEDIQC